MSDHWHGLHRAGWGKRLRPASFAHPAKVNYGLSVRIYEHALEKGWIAPGQTVLDPFAEIGGFALEAMRHGLHFVGCELEQRFVDMGQGCDCTGISKADWVRFQGRWDRMRYEGGRHWCPECLMKAGLIANEQRVFVRKFKEAFSPLPLPGTERAVPAKMRQVTILDAAPSASYVRNSGKIPCTPAHHYRGNIETWQAQGVPGSAVIVRGDSRRLGKVLAEASLCLSSPPYGGNVKSDRTHERRDERRLGVDFTGRGRGCFRGSETYGQTEGNLGNLPDIGFEAALATDCDDTNYEGEFPEGHCSPLLQDGGTAGNVALSPPAYVVVPEKPPDAVATPQGTQRTNHNALAEAQEGIGQPTLALGSPPYANVEGFHDKQFADKWGPKQVRTVTPAGYGNSDGQLAALPEGDHVEACERPAIAISSPPFLGSLNDGLRESDREKYAEFARAGRGVGTNYGSEEGQLGQMPPGDHRAALEAEPLYAGCLDNPSQKADYTGTGGPVSPGIGCEEMPEAGAEIGQAQACISSPPWENVVNTKDQKYIEEKRLFGDYGTTAGQLGQQQGSTFWAASRQILKQVYDVLAPGGHAIWVLKMFVRSGRLVDFPGQWEQLCQSVGFRTVCKHHAWLNKNAGIMQTTLDGDEVSMEKWFKGFFRRLCESKGSPRIDFETVLCMVKE